MGNIQNGEIDYSDLVYSSDSSDIAKYSLQEDDLLFNRTNSAEWVGNTIYLADFPEDGLYHMIDLAYDTVLNSFSKKVQKVILLREK